MFCSDSFVAVLKRSPVLIVNPDAALGRRLADSLASAGYDPTVVAGFEDALKMLKAEAFDVVVAAERLGTHNGLHLAIRARTERPVVAIVTCTDPDRLLEIDARELGATCLVAPWLNPADFLAVIGRLTGAAHV